ncbi:MAG: DUF1801 domain-containing protein [Saprospiraceae bacterium]
MAELKTKPNDLNVNAFLDAIADEKRRADCYKMVEIMEEVIQEAPRMWGPSIVGFGEYHYKYASGREGDWFITGFAPRKNDLTLYIMGGLKRQQALLEQLGKHKTGKSCLYIKKLDDVNIEVLKQMLVQGAEAVRTGQVEF